MKRTGKFACFLFCLCLFCLAAVALFPAPTPEKPEPQTIPGIEAKIAVDGNLDETAWQQALELDLPVETEPGENIPAPVRTTVRILYDKDNIYFGLECFDPAPAWIRARSCSWDTATMPGATRISAWPAPTARFS